MDVQDKLLRPACEDRDVSEGAVLLLTSPGDFCVGLNLPDLHMGLTSMPSAASCTIVCDRKQSPSPMLLYLLSCSATALPVFCCWMVYRPFSSTNKQPLFDMARAQACHKSCLAEEECWA